jgi:hypothetical protein
MMKNMMMKNMMFFIIMVCCSSAPADFGNHTVVSALLLSLCDCALSLSTLVIIARCNSCWCVSDDTDWTTSTGSARWTSGVTTSVVNVITTSGDSDARSAFTGTDMAVICVNFTDSDPGSLCGVVTPVSTSHSATASLALSSLSIESPPVGKVLLTAKLRVFVT